MREIERLKQQHEVSTPGHQLKDLQVANCTHARLSKLLDIMQEQLKDAIHEKDKALYQLQKLESDHEDLRILYR